MLFCGGQTWQSDGRAGAVEREGRICAMHVFQIE
jgi:hypothetical protein